jgi:hypothetical protein
MSGVTPNSWDEDQQDAVPVADLAQPLEITGGRQHHARGAGDGLDDHGGDGRCIVQRRESLEVVGELDAMRGHAARERIAREIVRVSQVVDAGDHGRGPGLAVGDHAADADAAEAHAVIAAFPT